MNPKIMNPNNDFQVIKHRSRKTINIDIVGSKQEQNIHSTMNEKHQSMYNILTIDDDEEMDVINDEGKSTVQTGALVLGKRRTNLKARNY